MFKFWERRQNLPVQVLPELISAFPVALHCIACVYCRDITDAIVAVRRVSLPGEFLPKGAARQKGSSFETMRILSGLAQLVEHLIRNEGVASSSLASGAKYCYGYRIYSVKLSRC